MHLDRRTFLGASPAWARPHCSEQALRLKSHAGSTSTTTCFHRAIPPQSLRWDYHVAEWTPARSIEEMDRSGIAISVVSLVTADVVFPDAPLVRRLARE